MFLIETDQFAPDSTGGPKMAGISFGKSVEEAIAAALEPARIEKFFLTLEKDALNLNTKVANGLEANLKSIQSTIYNVYKDGLDYGFAYGDAKDYIEAIATASQKMVNITTENVKGAVMLSKAMGIGAKEVGVMYASMMQMGMGQEKTRQILEKTFKEARAYGVDASKLTQTVSENIFKAQAYGFKGGVDGLREMAIQAQRVGVGMELAAKAADKAFDPEGAIEMASSLQMLGGNMGGLTDVHSLMYMAQSDMGALQDTIIKTSASMVDFNSTTGEFKISPEMRRNMTDYAKAMNLSYDEVAKGAIKARKEQEVMSRIPLSAGFSEADKSFISAMGELGKNKDTGKVTIELTDPKTGQLIDATQLSSTELKTLKEKYDEANKPIEKVAQEQLAVSDKMAKTLEEIKNAGIFGTGLGTGMKIPETINSTLLELTKNTSESVAASIKTFSLGEALVTTYTTTLQTLTSVIETSFKGLNTAIYNAKLDMIEAAKETKETKKTEEKGSTSPPPPTPTPTPTPTPYIPSFINMDQSSNMNKTLNSTDLNIQKGVLSSSVEKLIPLPMKELSKSEPIERYVENKIINEVNIGGKTELEITLKTPDNNSEKILSLLLNNPELKETVMATINERLSKEYSDKLINVLPG
jgi:hypothetical protein